MESPRAEPLVLLADCDVDSRSSIARWVTDARMRAVECADAHAFFDSLNTTMPDVVCVDLSLTGLSTRKAIEAVRQRHPSAAVLMLSDHASADSIADAMQGGAFDYLSKPVQRRRLLSSIRCALRPSQQTFRLQLGEADGEVSYAGLVGRSPQMGQVFRQVDKVASRDINVLIAGDSGTGKELIGRAIHKQSRRSSGPFVAVNCATIPEARQDSTLFGHEQGAFPGAHTAQAGCLEEANGGTLFLDAVGELSLKVQAKLLRVLEQEHFERVGGVQTVTSDFRLITATDRPLQELVDQQRFREDLYFRMVVFEIDLPPLREREGDLPLLVSKILQDLSHSLTSPPLRLTASAMAALRRYPFPGNVRELENVLQCAAVLASNAEIDVSDLPGRVRRAGVELVPHGSASRGAKELRDIDDLPLTLEDLERWGVERALRDTDGRLTETAKLLGIGRTTLYRKLEKYGLR